MNKLDFTRVYSVVDRVFLHPTLAHKELSDFNDNTHIFQI